MTVTVTATFPTDGTVLVRVQAQDATWTTLAHLERTDPWGNRFRVRGADNAALTGGVIIVADNETPLGCPVTYIATVSKGATTEQGQVTVNVPVKDPTISYLADANQPDSYIVAHVVEWGDVSRSSDVGVFEVLNRQDPVVTTGKIGAREGSITLATRTQRDTDVLWGLVNATDVILFRTSRQYGVGVAYMAVTKVAESRVTRLGPFPQRRFTIDFTFTGPPAGAGAASGWNKWQTVLDYNTTWQKVLDTRASWEDVYTTPYGAGVVTQSGPVAEPTGVPSTEDVA